MNLLKTIFAAVALTVLGACGGGGGSAGAPIASPKSSLLGLQVFDSSNAPVSNVTFGGANYVKATFKEAGGAPIVGRTVTFGLAGAAIAEFPPFKTTSTTALTNSAGEAQVLIAPLSVATQGAATLTAQASSADGTSYSGSIDFAVAAAAITLGPLNLGSSTLNTGGNTSVTVTAQFNSLAAVGVGVSLMADCGTVNPVITTDGTGTASGTYSAVKTDGTSCRGLVTLSASAVGSTVRNASLTVAAPVANAINFVSATPTQIFIKGSGAAEQSVALFKVLDSGGVAMPNVPVVFSLTINPGGVGLGASGAVGTVTANSDASGIATVTLFSGTIPGPVEVKAALANTPTVFTTSKNLTVASGPPSQNHFSLSVGTVNLEGATLDGASTDLTVRVADRQGNPVADGTVINFTAEGGQVAPSCATLRDVAGHAVCSVKFITQNPRTVDGRVSVLAYAEGHKEYIDANGNNAYDAGLDTLVDIGDAYRDDNENGQYDGGEFVIPKSGVALCAGAGSPFPARANTCTGAANQSATVRQQTVLLFASGSAAFTLISAANSFVTVRVNSAGYPLLPMPYGTTISAATTGTCKAGTITPATVPNKGPGLPSTQLGTLHTIALSTCAAGDTVMVIATSPSGVVSTASYSVPAAPVVPVPDVTPPTSLLAYTALTSTSVKVLAQLSESGTGYYIVQSSLLPAPTLAQVLLTGTALPMSAGVPVSSAVVGGLTTATSYVIYFAAKDAAGNAQTTLDSISFTTP